MSYYKYKRCLHSSKNSGICKQEDNLARYTEIFRKFVPEMFVPFGFPPRILELLVEWFAFQNSTISRFSKNFPRKFPCHLNPFQVFLHFWLNGKCLNTLPEFNSSNKLWLRSVAELCAQSPCVFSHLVMNASEAGGDLALIQTSLLLSCKCQLVSIRTTWSTQ